MYNTMERARAAFSGNKFLLVFFTTTLDRLTMNNLSAGPPVSPLKQRSQELQKRLCAVNLDLHYHHRSNVQRLKETVYCVT